MSTRTKQTLPINPQPPLAVACSEWLGGTINVTREEFAAMKRIMRGMPGHDVSEATEVCALLGLKLKEMAHKKWTVKVVDKIEARIVPPNDQAQRPGQL